jgi:hypothetical protein
MWPNNHQTKLPSAFCLLLSAFCFLPSAFCLQLSAFYPLHALAKTLALAVNTPFPLRLAYQ